MADTTDAKEAAESQPSLPQADAYYLLQNGEKPRRVDSQEELEEYLYSLLGRMTHYFLVGSNEENYCFDLENNLLALLCLHKGQPMISPEENRYCAGDHWTGYHDLPPIELDGVPLIQLMRRVTEVCG